MRKQTSSRYAAVTIALMVACLWGGSALAQSSGRNSGDGQAWIGIYTQDVGDDLRESLNLEGDGALVTRIVEGSPAARAGMQRRDYIVRFGSHDVGGAEELTDLVQSARVGQNVQVTVIREGQRRTLNVTLGRRTDTPTPEATRDKSWSVREKAKDKLGDADRDDDNDGDAEDDDGDMEIHGLRELHDLDGKSFSFQMPDGDMSTLFGQNIGSRGRLGVRVEELNGELGEALGYRGGKGVLVMEVMDDTPAKRAGLRAGDVIVGVGDRTVDDSESLIQALRSQDEGPVKVQLVRRGQRMTLEPRLEARPEPMTVRVPRVPRVRAERMQRPERPMARDEVRREALEQELQRMREELRQLREKLEELDR